MSSIEQIEAAYDKMDKLINVAYSARDKYMQCLTEYNYAQHLQMIQKVCGEQLSKVEITIEADPESITAKACFEISLKGDLDANAVLDINEKILIERMNLPLLQHTVMSVYCEDWK